MLILVVCQYVLSENLICLKYWCKFLNTDNYILNLFLLDMYERTEYNNKDNWTFHIKHEYNNLGFSDVWTSQQLDPLYLPFIKQRLIDQAQQVIQSQISASPKCTYYQHYINNFTLQYYLTIYIPERFRKAISRYRLSSHNLVIVVDTLILINKIDCVQYVITILKTNFILY